MALLEAAQSGGGVKRVVRDPALKAERDVHHIWSMGVVMVSLLLRCSEGALDRRGGWFGGESPGSIGKDRRQVLF